MSKSKFITIEYINQFDYRYTIEINRENQLSNLMEIVRDYGYEDWGECRGRAWCKTCHVAVSPCLTESINVEEEHALQDVENRKSGSRLACQIPINRQLDKAVISYLGDN